MKIEELVLSNNNVFYPNINILRNFIYILYNYPQININNDINFNFIDFYFSGKELPYDINNNLILDLNLNLGTIQWKTEYSRNYSNLHMNSIEFFDYKSGYVIFKLILDNYNYSIETYLTNEDDKLILNFLNSDFTLDLEKFKKSRIRKMKIEKLTK